jgi:hypothetical protein
MSRTRITTSVISDEFQTSHSLAAAATVNLDFDAAQVFTLVPDQNTTFTFSDFSIGMVKILRINGTGASKTLTFPTEAILLGGAYDDTSNVKNFIQIVCTSDAGNGEFFYTISKPS